MQLGSGTIVKLEKVCQPRSARRVPPPHRELLSETVFEPEARRCMAIRASAASRATFWRPASWRAPGGARNEGSVRALRGVLSLWFLFFARAKKRNLPWVSHPRACVPEGDTMKKNPPRAAFVIYTLDYGLHPCSPPRRGQASAVQNRSRRFCPAFAGMTTIPPTPSRCGTSASTVRPRPRNPGARSWRPRGTRARGAAS